MHTVTYSRYTRDRILLYRQWTDEIKLCLNRSRMSHVYMPYITVCTARGNCQGVNVLSLHAIAFAKSAYWIKFGCSFNFLWYFLANTTTWCISLRKVLWHIVELLRCDGIQLHHYDIGTMIGLRQSLH